jgi:predicted AAA+ superfamily ATPase
MRDDAIRGRLIEVNPWWRAAAGAEDSRAWAATDPTLGDRMAFDLGYRASVLDDIAHGPIDDKLVVLRGPRRVGKSVALKDTLLHLCGRPDIDPRQLVYLPADGMQANDLHRVAVLGRELTRSVDRDGTRPRAWFLDEVTAVDGWTEELKYLRDNTELKRDTVVCTGSSWSDTSQAERHLLAGRAGTGSVRRTRLLLPMKFRDVLAATRPRLPRPEPVPSWALQSDAAQEGTEAVELFVDELDLAWQTYLESGGFPRAVAEHARHGQVSEAFCADLAAWLQRDVDPDAPADSVPMLLAGLHERSASPLNRTNAATALGYPTRQTFDARLNRLVRSFAALWCHQIDDGGRRVAGSQSKLYLADPLLARLAARLRAGAPTPDTTVLTEAALAVALAQAVEAQQPGRWVADDAIGYVRTGSGNEIDFGPVPVPTPGGTERTTPLESKWVPRGWRADARTVEGRYGRGVVATRNLVNFDHPAWAIPAPVVALLLG